MAADFGGSRALGRRDLLKLGTGVLGAAMTASHASAQRGGGAASGPVPPPGSPPPDEWRPHTGPGYKYTANRLGGNGPMDETTQTIVKFVSQYSESSMT